MRKEQIREIEGRRLPDDTGLTLSTGSRGRARWYDYVGMVGCAVLPVAVAGSMLPALVYASHSASGGAIEAAMSVYLIEAIAGGTIALMGYLSRG